MNRHLDWIEEERFLKEIVGGREVRPMTEHGGKVDIIDDADPMAVIVDDGAPIFSF